MRPLRPRCGLSEKVIQSHLVANLRAAGWHVIKIHGSRFMAGMPDLFCVKDGRQVWVEVKRPNGQLERSQRNRFPKLVAAGVPIYVATSEDVSLLDGPPNVGDWLPQ